MTTLSNDLDSAADSHAVVPTTAVTNTSFKLVQITDSHLQLSPQKSYRGVDVEERLLSVLQHVQRNHDDIDALVLSGDLVHHGHQDGYRRLADYMRRFDCPWYWIPGNHDCLSTMNIVRQNPSSGFSIPGWRVLLLDSTSSPDGRGAGALATSELKRLQQQLQLADSMGQSLLLVLHHNPMPVQSRWQDAIMLSNAAEFWALLERYSVAVTVLFGHLHQQWDLQRGGVRLLGCPATSVQFKANQSQLLIEDDGEQSAPGYRWLKLPVAPEPNRLSFSRIVRQPSRPLSPGRDQVETAIVRVGLA